VNRAAQHLVRVGGLVLAAGLASTFLVRYSPGALVDERELNQRLSEDDLAALRSHRADSSRLGANFLAYLKGLAHGDLGYSESNNSPVAALIADRAPATLRELAIGLSGGWLIGLGLAIPIGLIPGAWLLDTATGAFAGLLMSLPAALLAYFCLAAGAASSAVLVIVLAPRVFRFARNLLAQSYQAVHVEAARSRGIRERTILWAHVVPDVAPQFLALFASSVSMAIGAAIPIEAICDTPGLGRLAWQAAMARDVPLLVNLTMLVALATILSAMVADLLTHRENAP